MNWAVFFFCFFFVVFLAFIQIFLKLHCSVAHHLSECDYTEIICFLFANPQNNIISDMPV